MEYMSEVTYVEESPNNHMHRAGTHKVLGRGRDATESCKSVALAC